MAADGYYLEQLKGTLCISAINYLGQGILKLESHFIKHFCNVNYVLCHKKGWETLAPKEPIFSSQYDIKTCAKSKHKKTIQQRKN